MINWTDQYLRANPYPCTPERRFLIAQYQTQQGFYWDIGNPNRYEGFAAASLHILMLAWQLNLEPLTDLNAYWLEAPGRPCEDHELTFFILQQAQQVVYGAQGKATQRAQRRYTPRSLSINLARLIEILSRDRIPSNRRRQAFHDATTILCEKL